MIWPILLGAHLHQKPPLWFGPSNVQFDVQFSGDPYDPAQNDVKVQFTTDDGRTEERLAYFDGTTWRASFLAHRPGFFKAVLIRNGKPQPDITPNPLNQSIQDPLVPGFIHVDPEHANRFLREDGTPYIPIGYNLAYQLDGGMKAVDQIAQMGTDGLTWTRLWSTYLDQKDPWWPINDPSAIKDRIWEQAILNWDALIRACDWYRLPFEVTFFNAVDLTTHWSSHPWNTANGGFIREPKEFFTDAEAKRREKLWLRYLVVRCEADPNLVAFELFDSPEQTGADPAAISAWNAEMAAYVRSLDPYGHMVTETSSPEHPELWNSLDFYQASVSDKFPKDKPCFISALVAQDSTALRNSLYATLFESTGGPAQLWSWAEVATNNWSKEFKTLALAAKAADLGRDAIPDHFNLTTISGVKAGEGIGRTDWALARVRLAAPGTAAIRGFSTPDSSYRLTIIDPDSAEPTTEDVVIKNGVLTFQAKKIDLILVIRR